MRKLYGAYGQAVHETSLHLSLNMLMITVSKKKLFDKIVFLLRIRVTWTKRDMKLNDYAQKQSVSIHRPLMSLLMMSWLLVSQSIRHHCLNVILFYESAIYMRLEFFLQPLFVFTAITFLVLFISCYMSLMLDF